jgi:hypothetical protein
MINPASQKRIIALDVRSRSYGYVVLEGPKQLLDWGVRSFRKGVNTVRVPAAEKLGVLFDEFAPTVIVLNKRISHRTRRHAGLVGSIVRQADQRGIPARFFSHSGVRNAFAGHDRNRHEVASLLASEFPELAARLPRKRRCQDNEDYRMSMFDAAALGVAYFSRYAKRPRDTSTENSVPVRHP